MDLSKLIRDIERFKDRLKTDEPISKKDIEAMLLDISPKFKPVMGRILKDLPDGELSREVKDNILRKMG
jgi:hypothetical protein